MDINKIIARVKAILLTPKTEWPVIAGEPTTIGDLYKGYIAIIAALPAIAGFIDSSIIGTDVWLAGRVRIGIGAGLAQMIVSYLLTLGGAYVVALIVEALAPTFNGQKDRTQALKAVAYSFTAGWVASIAVILPWLGGLIAFAGAIYGIYLLYLGLPHTMKCPQEKAGGYTAVTIIVTIVLYILLFSVVWKIVGFGGGIGAGSTFGGARIEQDSPLGKLEEWSKNVEEAGKRLEEAQKSGDQQAQSDALGAFMGAALGGGEIEPLAADRLKAFLPGSLAGLPRANLSAERNSAMGLKLSQARAEYRDESGRSLQLEIMDTGSARGLLALAGFAGWEGEREDGDSVEKVYRASGRLVRESWDGASRRGEYTVVLGDRFTVSVEGDASAIDELRSAAAQVDLRGLEALKNEGVKKRN